MDTSKNIISLKMNWMYILSFCVFWCYAFCNYFFVNPLTNHILIKLALYSVFLLFLILGKNSFYNFEINISKQNIITFFLCVFFLTAITFQELIYPLGRDQLCHVNISQWFSTSLSCLLTTKFSHLATLPLKYIIWFFNLFFIIFMAVAVRISKNKSMWFKIILYSLIYLLFVNIPNFLDKSAPLRIFPLWSLSSIFPPSDVSFKFSQIIILSVFLVYIEEFLKKYVSTITAFLICLTFATIPLFLHTSLIIDSNLWPVIIFVTFFLETTYLKKINYTKWFCLIPIFTMMRINCILLYLPLIIFYILDVIKKNEKIDKKILLYYTLPTLLMVYYVFENVVYGSPATYIDGSHSFIPVGAGALERVLIALKMGTVFKAIIYSFGFYTIFALISFIPFSKSEIKIRSIYFVFFSSLLITFYSIDPMLWGVGKYQIEYFYPFIAFGLISVFLKIHSLNIKILNNLINAVLIILIFANIITFKKIPKLGYDFDEFVDYDQKNWYPQKLLTSSYYDYNMAFKALKANNFYDSYYIIGLTYSSFNSVMNGANANEYVKLQNIFDNQNQFYNFNFEKIDEDKDIKVVLISDVPRENIINEFEQSPNWSHWEDFYSKKYRTTIVSYIRN